MHSRRNNSRHIQVPTGPNRSAKSWTTEAAMRMLMNNLDPRVAEAPEELSSMAASGGRRIFAGEDA